MHFPGPIFEEGGSEGKSEGSAKKLSVTGDRAKEEEREEASLN